MGRGLWRINALPGKWRGSQLSKKNSNSLRSSLKGWRFSCDEVVIQFKVWGQFVLRIPFMCLPNKSYKLRDNKDWRDQCDHLIQPSLKSTGLCWASCLTNWVSSLKTIFHLHWHLGQKFNNFNSEDTDPWQRTSKGFKLPKTNKDSLNHTFLVSFHTQPGLGPCKHSSKETFKSLAVQSILQTTWSHALSSPLLSLFYQQISYWYCMNAYMLEIVNSYIHMKSH